MATPRTVLKRTAAQPPADPNAPNWGSQPPGSSLQPAQSPFMSADEFEEVQTDVDRVMSLIQQNGDLGRASVKVHKIVEGKNKFCQSYTPSEFEEGGYDMIREAFGAGDYRVSLYGTNAEGQFGILTRADVGIVESKAPRAAAPTGAIGGELAQVLTMLAQGQQQIMETIMTIRSAPAPDPIAQLTPMLGLMTAMREAMGITPQQPQQRQSGLTETLAAIRELKEMAKEINPPGDGDGDSLASSLPAILDIVKSGMEQGRQQPPVALPGPTGQRMPAVHLPPSIQNNPAPIQQPQPTADEMTTLQAMKAQLNELLAMSDAGKTTDEASEFVYDEISDDLAEALHEDNWLQMLLMFEPRAKDYSEWLTEVRNKAIVIFRTEAEKELGDGTEQPANLEQSPT